MRGAKESRLALSLRIVLGSILVLLFLGINTVLFLAGSSLTYGQRIETLFLNVLFVLLPTIGVTVKARWFFWYMYLTFAVFGLVVLGPFATGDNGPGQGPPYGWFLYFIILGLTMILHIATAKSNRQDSTA